MAENITKKESKFSFGLGLLDYINPIFYSITALTIIKNMYGVMNIALFVLFVAGATFSIVYGLTIPTVKCIVGLGIMEFKMPVNLVFYVNSGILVSGLALSGYVLKLKAAVMVCIFVAVVAVLFALYKKTKKFNTVAVLTGFAGYLLIYITLISIAVASGMTTSIVLYGIAICLFVLLVFIGIKSDLMNPKVHWAIEISNVLCQGSVALATVLLFKGL